MSVSSEDNPGAILGGGLRNEAVAAHLVEVEEGAHHARWLLLVVGFPCHDLIGLNAKRKGLEGKRSGLIHEIPRVRDLLTKCWPAVQVVVLAENVSSMPNWRRTTFRRW